MECDYTVGPQHPKIEVGSPENYVPIVRMFGVTAEGHSVLVNVYGVLPYFYVAVPNDEKWRQYLDDRLKLCDIFRRALDDRMQQESSQIQSKAVEVTHYVLSVEIEEKASIMHYRNHKYPFFRITMALPKHVPIARGILEKGLIVGPLGVTVFNPTYESNVLFALRFMIDKDIVGCNWIEIPAGKYLLPTKRTSNTQIEVDVSHENIISHKPDGDWLKLAPLRILSFDIECAGRQGAFPEAKHDPVIQIANYVTVQGNPKPLVKNVFVLGNCSPLVDADIRCFRTEKEMLMAWREFILELDPDILTGWNVVNFDIPYLFNRAEALGLTNFPKLGRILDTPTKLKKGTFSSKAYGTHETTQISMYGRVFFDVLQAIQRDYKLRSYSLNSVSAEFLGEQKEDVHYSIITRLHNGSDDDRRRLAAYCLKDAYLPQRLLSKLMCIINYIEMARVTGVPFSYLLTRGQSIKVVSQLYRKANKEGLLVPTYKSSASQETYEGAVVIKPKKGFYPDPIVTLDFSSLYPSIMMAHNLCYSTLLPSKPTNMNPEDYTETPSEPKNYFVKPHIKKGILPQILEDLIEARKKAKKDLAQEKDPIKKAVLDGRQLALKISANSVYGFTGASVGQLPCLEISSSVTAYGRAMILMTKDIILNEYTMKNGYPKDAEVIYGDTDSVMINFGVKTIEEAMKLGKEAAKLVTSKFMKPISLEFEKCYYPYLLISKKRYAGLLWTKPDKWDKIDAKGIESVRRDNCPLVKYVIDTCLKKILIDKDHNAAVQFVQNIISDLLCNRLDLSLLVITKALSKSEEDYKTVQAHTALAERIRQRDPANAPNIGDRVPYVIVKGPKGAKGYEKSEDPIWVLNNNIPLDTQYYLEHQLSQPLCRLFSPFFENPEKVFMQGEHTRQIALPTPKSGGIVGFTTVTERCMGCRAALQDGETVLCEHCRQRAPEVYERHLNLVRQKEHEFHQLWTQCQNCQGSLHQEVLCTARDCPIFYMRTKVQKDLKDARKQLERFDLSW